MVKVIQEETSPETKFKQGQNRAVQTWYDAYMLRKKGKKKKKKKKPNDKIEVETRPLDRRLVMETFDQVPRG